MDRRSFVCFAGLFIFFTVRVSARPVPLLVSGADAPVPVETEWEESRFSTVSAYTYDHGIARVASVFAQASYADKGPADGSLLLTDYGLLGMRPEDVEFHYDIDYTDSMWGNDQCAFSIASREIPTAAGRQTLVFLVIRGTPVGANEWLSNLNINDGDKMADIVHKGFVRAANQVHTALISYLLRHKIDPTDSYLLVTGHSRGGAVSNLLGRLLLEDQFFKSEHMFIYTFASPNVTTDEHAGDDVYGFIWNIINAEDIVPTVPINRDAWKYRKYGRCRSFFNCTNTDDAYFKEQCMPRLNRLFVPQMGREYHPFMTGPFVPILVTTVINNLNSSVERFYSGRYALHDRAASLLVKAFGENKDSFDESEDAADSQKSLGSRILSWLDRRTNGGVEYVTHALYDMHGGPTYVSFMNAFSEAELFTEIGYSTIVVNGNEELAVMDKSGNRLCRILDGRVQYGDFTMPVIACPALGGNIIIGFPSNLEFDLVMTNETLLPTGSWVTVERFDSCGVYIGSSQKRKLYLHRSMVYMFGIGGITLRTGDIQPEKLYGKTASELVRQNGLAPQWSFRIEPEVNMNIDLHAGMGLHVGLPVVYATLLTGNGLAGLGKSVEFSLGGGTQQSIIGPVRFDAELLAKFLWILDKNDDDDRRFNLVPMLRTSLSVRFLRTMRLFIAGLCEMNIEGFNEDAFDSYIRRKTMRQISLNSSVRVVPSIQFGLRF